MTIKNKILKIFLLFFSLPFMAMLVSCGKNNYNAKTIAASTLRIPYIKMADDQLVNKLLKFKPQTAQEIKEEDERLIDKYKNIYNVNNALYVDQYDFWSRPNGKNDEKVVIFLQGGPKFLWNNLDIKARINNLKLNPLKNDLNDLMNKMKDDKNFFGPNNFSTFEDFHYGYSITRYLSIKYKNEILKQSKNILISSFVEAQTQLLPEIMEKTYSFNKLKEIQKMNFIMLHQIIKKLHSKNKEVYLWGSSFGGTILEGYLSRYKNNDADGMLIAGSPINTSYEYDYAPGFEIKEDKYNNYLPTLQYIKSHMDEENMFLDLPGFKKEYPNVYSANNYNLIKDLQKYLNRNFINFMIDSNGLINSKKFLKIKLKNVVFLIGTKDDRFEPISNKIKKWKKDFYKIKKWTWNNISKSEADIRYLQEAHHTSDWKGKYYNISASPGVMWLMTNKIEIPDISTREKYLQNVEKKYFKNN